MLQILEDKLSSKGRDWGSQIRILFCEHSSIDVEPVKSDGVWGSHIMAILSFFLLQEWERLIIVKSSGHRCVKELDCKEFLLLEVKVYCISLENSTFERCVLAVDWIAVLHRLPVDPRDNNLRLYFPPSKSRDRLSCEEVLVSYARGLQWLTEPSVFNVRQWASTLYVIRSLHYFESWMQLRQQCLTRQGLRLVKWNIITIDFISGGLYCQILAALSSAALATK